MWEGHNPTTTGQRECACAVDVLSPLLSQLTRQVMSLLVHGCGKQCLQMIRDFSLIARLGPYICACWPKAWASSLHQEWYCSIPTLPAADSPVHSFIKVIAVRKTKPVPSALKLTYILMQEMDRQTKEVKRHLMIFGFSEKKNWTWEGLPRAEKLQV